MARIVLNCNVSMLRKDSMMFFTHVLPSYKQRTEEYHNMNVDMG